MTHLIITPHSTHPSFTQQMGFNFFFFFRRWKDSLVMHQACYIRVVHSSVFRLFFVLFFILFFPEKQSQKEVKNDKKNENSRKSALEAVFREILFFGSFFTPFFDPFFFGNVSSVWWCLTHLPFLAELAADNLSVPEGRDSSILE